MQELDHWVGMARQSEELRVWGDAARHWEQAADRAYALRQPAAARTAWDRAGEAWRRDDRPQLASRALHQALVLSGGMMEAGLSRVKLAAVLGELGQYRAAVSLCEAALRADLTAPVRALALDTWLGAVVHIGLRAGRAEALEELGGLFAVAAAFRRVQALHLDGHLHAALLELSWLEQELALDPAMEAGVAAALGERGELSLLLGDGAAALAAFEEASSMLARLERHSLRFRADAGRLRALVASGVAVHPGTLAEGMAWAKNREIPMLFADLVIAAADAHPDIAALEAVVHLTSESTLRRGRALLALAKVHPNAEALRQDALVALATSRPWRARAQLALGMPEAQAELTAMAQEPVGTSP